jgi:phytoene desaturase
MSNLGNGKSKRSQVLVIGGGLGGLSAAIHLRLRGYDVLLLEANDQVGGRANQIKRDGFTFDTGPTLLNYPWVFEQLFRDAGRRLEDYVTLTPVDPSIRFLWSNGTEFTLSSNLQRLLAECERLDSGTKASMLDYLMDASIKYRASFDKLVTSNEGNPLKWIGALRFSELSRLSVWRSLDRELARYFKSPYIRQAFGSYAMYLGGSPFDLPGLFSILAYGELAYGLWLPKGGIYGMVRAIERLASELGVEILTRSRVKKIMVERNRVQGVELVDGCIHRSSIVVSNVDVPTTNEKLLEGKASPVRGPKMTPGVITFYWGVEGKIERLGHHTIFLPQDFTGAFDDLFRRKQIPGGLPFYAATPSTTDATLAPPGATSMFVLVPTPLLSELEGSDWSMLARRVKTQVFEIMRRHEIDLDPSRIFTEEIYTPADWRARFGLFNGSAFGAAHTLFQIGPFRSRNYSREIEGLYYTGASTTPGTGLPMVVLGGKMTAERIEARVH